MVLLKLNCEKCDAICSYLRESYAYCVWCASSYASKDELDRNCPGLTQAEHEFDE